MLIILRQTSFLLYRTCWITISLTYRNNMVSSHFFSTNLFPSDLEDSRHLFLYTSHNFPTSLPDCRLLNSTRSISTFSHNLATPSISQLPYILPLPTINIQSQVITMPCLQLKRKAESGVSGESPCKVYNLQDVPFFSYHANEGIGPQDKRTQGCHRPR